MVRLTVAQSGSLRLHASHERVAIETSTICLQVGSFVCKGSTNATKLRCQATAIEDGSALHIEINGMSLASMRRAMKWLCHSFL